MPRKYNLFKENNKELYWKDTLNSTPNISPDRTYNKINKNPAFSLRVRTIAHAYIYLEYYFGPQYLHMKGIEFLAHCQRCMPKGICPCNGTCTNIKCGCSCHRPTSHYNSPYHSIFCTSLIPMWATILKIAGLTSIALPLESHLLKWCLITADLAYMTKQNMKPLWYQLYSIYIQIIYRIHYNPLPHPTSYQNKFLARLIHQIKISHLKLLKDLETNKASLRTANEIDKKNTSLIHAGL